MKQIEIDLDVHRFIENARKDFNESENSILRRLLGIEEINKVQESSNLSYSLSLSEKRKALQSLGELGEKISGYQARSLSHRIDEVNSVMSVDWVYGGASLPEGTVLQKWLKRQKFEAVIHDGSISVNGEYHQSPSSAAMAVNGGTNVNGWGFWEYFDESTRQWIKLNKLRKKKKS